MSNFKEILIHTFIDNTHIEAFNIAKNVKIVYYDNYEDVFSNNNNIILIPFDNFEKLYGLEQKLYNYLKTSPTNKVIISRIFESSYKILNHIREYNLQEFVNKNQIKILISAEFDDNLIGYCFYDVFQNLIQSDLNVFSTLRFSDDFFVTPKPYKFLYLNGRNRAHREKLFDMIEGKNLLSQSLWSFIKKNKNLPKEYEDFFNDKNYSLNYGTINIKPTWPDNTINPKLYSDTYFSLVSETHFDETIYSFATEKTYKVLLVGHPFIIASNAGFYKFLHNKGYKTFGNLIDESFDKIENHDKRRQFIVNEVERLCKTDLDDFVIKAKPICEHNRLISLERINKVHYENYVRMEEFINKHLKLL